jgi:hypothetical protein
MVASSQYLLAYALRPRAATQARPVGSQFAKGFKDRGRSRFAGSHSTSWTSAGQAVHEIVRIVLELQSR